MFLSTAACVMSLGILDDDGRRLAASSTGRVRTYYLRMGVLAAALIFSTMSVMLV